MKLPATKRFLAGLADIAIIALSPVAAVWLRLRGIPSFNFGITLFSVGFFIGGTVGYLALRLYRGSWRYVSIEEFVGVLKCAILATIAGVFAVLLYGDLDGIPRSIFGLSFSAMLLMMVGPRLAYRLLKERVLSAPIFGRRQDAEPVLLYGFSDAAANFIRQSRRQPREHIWPIGIVAHHERHKGRILYDVPVMGTLDELPAIVARARARDLKVGKLILVIPKLSQEEIAEIVEQASQLGLKIMRVPHYAEFLDAENAPEIKVQSIDINDLLGRPPVDLDMTSIGNLFAGKRVLISGAGGSIGSEVCRQIANLAPSHISLLDNSEFNLYSIDGFFAENFPALSRSSILCDVRERDTVERVLQSEAPDIVYHAAALKHVPLMECNVVEACKTNILGTKNIADSALAVGCDAFVMISTDKAVNPTSVMGASKRFAEAYCQLLDRDSQRTRFMTVRFGNVLGSAGSVVPLFSRQIAAGGPVTVTHPEIERFFMTIPEAVRLVIAASARGYSSGPDRGRIFVLDMGKPVRILDLARKMIQLSGLRPDIDVKIEFIGLRPAEKLYEETFSKSENIMPTENSWLQIANYRAVNPIVMSEALAILGKAVSEGNSVAAIQGLRMIVPELTRDNDNAPAMLSVKSS